MLWPVTTHLHIRAKTMNKTRIWYQNLRVLDGCRTFLSHIFRPYISVHFRNLFFSEEVSPEGIRESVEGRIWFVKEMSFKSGVKDRRGWQTLRAKHSRLVLGLTSWQLVPGSHNNDLGVLTSLRLNVNVTSVPHQLFNYTTHSLNHSLTHKQCNVECTCLTFCNLFVLKNWVKYTVSGWLQIPRVSGEGQLGDPTPPGWPLWRTT